MASSKLMINMSSDLIRRKSSNNNNNSNNNTSSSSSSTSTSTNHKHPIRTEHNSGVFQMTVDGILHNNQQQQPSVQPPDTAAAAINGVQKSVDDVWKEIVAGRSCKQEAPDELMTLEDFLAKAHDHQKQEQEDVKIPPLHLPLALSNERLLSFDNAPNVVGFGIGVDDMAVAGRGKRRAILEPLDKAAQQRQRRMIKNRESAARSRERKQAYQAELESLALKLEQENHTLLNLKSEQTRKRYKQLMDNIIPVTEKRRPTKYVLRKVRSMEW